MHDAAQPINPTPEPAPEPPFRVEGGEAVFDTIGQARLEAGRWQRAGVHRSLRIVDARRRVVGLKRF